PSRGSWGPAACQFGPRAFEVTGKLRHARAIEVENFLFLKAHTGRIAKQTIPSPTMLLRGARDAVSREAYPDLAEFHAHIARVYCAEPRELGEAGRTLAQPDDANFASLCDPELREAYRRWRPGSPMRRAHPGKP